MTNLDGKTLLIKPDNLSLNIDKFITKNTTDTIKSKNFNFDFNTSLPPKYARCKEIRRRVSWGALYYAKWDGDVELNELVKPIFTIKRLVVWSIDHHFGPISDIRSIIEPLGVEFIEHSIIHPQKCHRMCNCDLSKERRSFDYNSWNPNKNTFQQISSDSIAAPDIARADAFLAVAQPEGGNNWAFAPPPPWGFGKLYV